MADGLTVTIVNLSKKMTCKSSRHLFIYHLINLPHFRSSYDCSGNAGISNLKFIGK